MGVKELWSIISPISEKKSLWELENKVIAIDLSAWICDSQSLHTPQNNMYLRNLFFRTSYLLLLGVKPVFVLEGVAPILKSNTIQQRLKNRNQKIDIVPEKKVSRSRLSSLQKQCVDLLSSLGILCIQGPGEAEAYCAHLNRLGIVDGVITQDSDVFLYGAREVFRNFQMSPHYSCDSYSMGIIETKLGLTRTKLVGYSLLVGSDYNCGIQNLGKQAAIKFLLTVPDDKIIQRFVEWRNDSFFKYIEENKFLNSDFTLEMKIREKCIQDEHFPDLEVVTEYMKEPADIEFSYKWSKPDIGKFVGIAVKKLNWEEDYAIQKFVPLLARWHLLNPLVESDLKITSIIGVPIGKNSYCYRVSWNKYDLVTIEPKTLVSIAYQDLVEEFEALKRSKKTKKKNVKKNNDEKLLKLDLLEEPSAKQNSDDVDEFDLSLVVETVKENKKRRRKNVKPKKDTESVEESQAGPSVNSTTNGNEDDEFNLSLIIRNIVSRPQSNPALSHLS
ncbi:flap endonuclease GEN [Halyomorpha halys]|uniref:flap endonuclease GEN n=1 Tax=Halyomorpha halys TaxID=286706 RepID=UPI0006D4E9EC|nr:flap endonuclease GEN [Halyomorpha halys]